MKRVLSWVFVVLFIFGNTAIAESVNLKGFTDEEIITLYESIKSEIVLRKIEKTAKLPQGEYLIGKDIPAGTYILRGTHSSDWWTDVYIYTAIEMQKSKDERKAEKAITVFDHSGEVVHKITLNDGDALNVIGSGEISITVSTGVLFE